MTSYTAIPNGDIDQDSPITQTLMTLMRDNPIAMFEEAPGAPKLKRKYFVSGAAGATQTFTGLGEYGGISAFLFGSGSSGSAQFAYSTNGGSSFSTPVSLATFDSGATPQQIRLTGQMHFDFATGVLEFSGNAAYSGITGGFPRVSTTVAGASLAIDAVRFTFPSQGVVMISPNGGTR